MKNFKVNHEQINLSTVEFHHPEEKGVLIVVNGLTETWLKYGEVFYDWYQKGFTILSYDHRGQGLSSHLVARNSQIAHVDRFQDYLDDFQFLITNGFELQKRKSKNIFVLAHSMGGAVVTRYLQTHPNTSPQTLSAAAPFRAVALSAPMLAINTAPYPESLAHIAVNLMNLAGRSQDYTFGKRDNDCYRSFDANQVTQSKARYWMDQLICKNEFTAVTSGPSNGWVETAISATRNIREDQIKIDIPMLMLQAGMDEFVVNEELSRFCSGRSNCTLQKFSGSKHEILMEHDPIRNLAMQKIEDFFSTHSQ